MEEVAKSRFRKLIVSQEDFYGIERWLEPILAKGAHIKSLELMNAPTPYTPWRMIWSTENLHELVVSSARDPIFDMVQAAVSTRRSSIRRLVISHSPAEDVFGVLCIDYLEYVSIAAEERLPPLNTDLLKYCPLERSQIKSVSLMLESRFEFDKLLIQLARMQRLERLTIDLADTTVIPESLKYALSQLKEHRPDIDTQPSFPNDSNYNAELRTVDDGLATIQI